jgi:hypothetical protein
MAVAGGLLHHLYDLLRALVDEDQLVPQLAQVDAHPPKVLLQRVLERLVEPLHVLPRHLHHIIIIVIVIIYIVFTNKIKIIKST